ncbi:uncharacterized protein LOC121467740 [Drosophila elegans]|uniref:uncharacterized protein LOC121467740 n=1 Tax=Drosophila elegans TaxID=30023 RepID=UPI001BC82EE2|nr:uncharacterized protein LOC121467740 [Drosophila elegans]
MTELKPFLCQAMDKALWRTEWEMWLRAFTIYVDTEEITNVYKKRNKLLHLGGPQLQAVVYSIPGALIPYDDKAKNDVFTPLVSKLNEYFSPLRNSAFERHLFRSMTPVEGEGFTEFLLRLRQQIAKCSFGETKRQIEEICLIDKIIDVWAPLDLKKKLLENEQTLEEVVKTCCIDEQVNKQTQSMAAPTTASSINKIIQHDTGMECGRCGRRGHRENSAECPARNMRCRKCDRLGHFYKKCRTRVRKSNFGMEEPDRKRRRQGNTRIQSISNETQNEYGDSKSTNLFRVATEQSGEEEIRCKISGHTVAMIIDSGSNVNAIKACSDATTPVSGWTLEMSSD